MDVLDYVLNRAGLREIDALAAAVERRRKDLTAMTGMGTLDPGRFAKDMAQTVQQSIDEGMEGMRRSFRSFAADLIRREAPELTESQMDDLLAAWIPDRPVRPGAASAGQDASSGRVPAGPERYAGLSLKGRVNGIPAEAMREMATQFVAYSVGRMSLADEASLRDAVGDWTAVYWNTFPDPLRSLIRDFLEGGFPEESFLRALDSMLA